MSKWAYPNILSNPNDDRFDPKNRYVDEVEFWEWYYDELEPYDEPLPARKHDLEYGEID